MPAARVARRGRLGGRKQASTARSAFAAAPASASEVEAQSRLGGRLAERPTRLVWGRWSGRAQKTEEWRWPKERKEDGLDWKGFGRGRYVEIFGSF
ncbi:hypothetical protein E2562_034134 [Oryza meyeriana var. granulata]|uniref:Uncharacterized protein n=1 Tax=Oryza meyeriana var. granulata TaxID=110450 RepID=A0A6G1E6E1_9ORYZ|nr:hypothetical protein E2562_034134 [Oryza meyeriana var. granulata]